MTMVEKSNMDFCPLVNAKCMEARRAAEAAPEVQAERPRLRSVRGVGIY